jgi:hypothetical protein
MLDIAGSLLRTADMLESWHKQLQEQEVHRGKLGPEYDAKLDSFWAKYNEMSDQALSLIPGIGSPLKLTTKDASGNVVEETVVDGGGYSVTTSMQPEKKDNAENQSTS